MNLDYKNTRYTLDYDRCTFRQLLPRIFFILIDRDTQSVRYRKSPRKKGYHVEVQTKIPVCVLAKRKKHGDDRNRMIHDILNRPDHIHDVLWNKKTINGKTYLAGKWYYMSR